MLVPLQPRERLCIQTTASMAQSTSAALRCTEGESIQARCVSCGRGRISAGPLMFMACGPLSYMGLDVKHPRERHGWEAAWIITVTPVRWDRGIADLPVPPEMTSIASGRDCLCDMSDTISCIHDRSSARSLLTGIPFHCRQQRTDGALVGSWPLLTITSLAA